MASRRKAEELILQGRVTVNGQVADTLGSKVEPADVVYFDGRPVEPEPLEYYLLNKPAGTLSTVSDPQGRPTVTQLVPTRARIFPIGRLDRDTSGLIILTNDGELAHRLMHPSFEVDKVYRAEVAGTPTEPELERLRVGVQLDDGPTAPAEVKFAGRRQGRTAIDITIHEGRKRQVRRMLEAVGHPVEMLHRKKYAMLIDKGLKPGDSRPLTSEEINMLKQLTHKGER